MLDKINADRYKDSCIIITGMDMDKKTFYHLQHNGIVNCVINKISDISNTVNKINSIVQNKNILKINLDIEKKIVKEILYLGYNFSHKGTIYLIEVIKFIAFNENKNTDNLEKNVYPKVASFYKDTTNNVKCNINRANNAMYYECDIEKMKKYFSFENDLKPNVKLVINTILNKILL